MRLRWIILTILAVLLGVAWLTARHHGKPTLHGKPLTY
jgi:hypothetical protein